MNGRQVQTLQRLSNALHRRSIMSNGTAIDGRLCFKATPQPDGTVLFNATNIFSDDWHWYCRTTDLYAFIGVRGSIKKYAGSLKVPS